jgi:hypothetical protein
VHVMVLSLMMYILQRLRAWHGACNGPLPDDVYFAVMESLTVHVIFCVLCFG